MRPTILLTAVLLLSIVGFLLESIGVNTTSWISFGTVTEGLWQACSDRKCEPIPSDKTDSQRNAARAFGIIAVLAGALTTAIVIVYIFVKQKTSILVAAIALSGAAALSSMIGFALFANGFNTVPGGKTYGYSFGLCVAAFFVFLINTGLLVFQYMKNRQSQGASNIQIFDMRPTILHIVVLLLSIIGLLLEIIGVATPSGISFTLWNPGTFGLWQVCGDEGCESFSSDKTWSKMKAAQAFGILAVLAGAMTIIIVIVYIFFKQKTGILVAAIAVSGATALCSMIEFAVFASHINMFKKSTFGYSFGLCVAAFVVFLINTGLLVFQYIENRGSQGARNIQIFDMPPNILLTTMLVLSIVGLLLETIGVATPSWLYVSGSGHAGLWQVCIQGKCELRHSDRTDSKMKAAQAFGVLAILAGALTIAIVIVYTFAKQTTCTLVAAIAVSTAAALSSTIGFAVFANRVNSAPAGSTFGHSFGLCVAAFVVFLINTGLVVFKYIKNRQRGQNSA